MNMIGIPMDGSRPFLMAILDFGNPQERAERLWRETAHMYVKKLASYRLEPRKR